MTRFARTALALGVLVFVAASLWAWPALGGQGTSFYVDCSFSSANGFLRVQIHDEDGLVLRRGDRIRVLAPTGGQPRYEAIDCGGTPTVDNTDLIRMRIDSEGTTTGRLSLSGGPFAPGLTSESGVPEIEIHAVAREDDQELRVTGTGQGDLFRAGRLSGEEWVNLNPNAEGVSPDGDLRLPNGGSAIVGFVTGRGRDTVALNGGREFTSPLGARRVFLRLGEGADHYSGRNPSAVIYAGRGADTIVTGRHIDIVLDIGGHDSIRTRDAIDGVFAVHGRDRVWTGEGNDLVITKDGRRDRINCGPGSDRASLDARDRARSCERKLDTSKAGRWMD